MKTDIREIDRLETIIKQVAADYKKLELACDAAIKAGAMSQEGPLFDAIWRTFDNMLHLVDFEGWIPWFIYENDGGKKGLRARTSKAGKPVAIRTPRQLAGMIVKHQNEKQP